MRVESTSLSCSTQRLHTHPMENRAEEHGKMCLEKDWVFLLIKVEEMNHIFFWPRKCQGTFSHTLHHFNFRKLCGIDKIDIFVPIWGKGKWYPEWLSDFRRTTALIGCVCWAENSHPVLLCDQDWVYLLLNFMYKWSDLLSRTSVGSLMFMSRLHEMQRNWCNGTSLLEILPHADYPHETWGSYHQLPFLIFVSQNMPLKERESDHSFLEMIGVSYFRELRVEWPKCRPQHIEEL